MEPPWVVIATAVSALSYLSYLLQRYLPHRGAHVGCPRADGDVGFGLEERGECAEHHGLVFRDGDLDLAHRADSTVHWGIPVVQS